MDVRRTYDTLIEHFGKSNIDSILCPCWDKGLEYRDRGGQPIDEYPYLNFVDNMEWFLNVLQKRGVKL